MKKKDQALSLISGRPGLLACPLCRGSLTAIDAAALRCPAGHSFDISSSGYVNLLTHAVKSDYGAAMLEARRRVCVAGFFDLLLHETADIIQNHAPASTGELVLLDAGSGEGSHLAGLAGLLGDGAGISVAGVGVDISKEGIRIAAREHPGFLWLVADLARLPLAEGSVDVIANILSPSNYAEFGRVLRPGGLVVKAVPGESYLQELRRALYAGGGREEYSNEKVVRLFGEGFHIDEQRAVKREFLVPPGLWPDIVAMTPLSWGKDESAVRTVLENPPDSVTLDFLLLAGSR